jgi:GNAT superfamily N-acetyltransferase
MVAHEGDHPIAVLHACKRPNATLILRLAVHPEHQRCGHGRHLLTSLSSKLAILGPPRLVAEARGDRREDVHAFLRACGYAEEMTLTDWVREGAGDTGPLDAWAPVTVDQLLESGAFEDLPDVAWERALPTLLARKDVLQGLAAASAERIEGWALWKEAGDTAEVWGARNLIPPLGWDRIVLPKLSESEVPARILERDGYRPSRRTVVFGARAVAA